MKKSITTTIALLMVVCLLVAGCQTITPAENPSVDAGATTQTPAAGNENVEANSTEKVIRFSIAAEPPTMDPQIKTASNMACIATHVFEGLVRVFNGEIKPGMAESWEISEDGKTYTFHIRQDAKWSDGTALTAKDFEYAFKRVLDPAVGSEFAYLAYDIVNGEAFNTGSITDFAEVGVQATDDYTLVINLNNPVSYFLSYMDFTLFSPTRADLVEQYTTSYGADADKIGCNGPYILEDWTHESSLTMVKNPNYWDAANVTTDRIEVYIVMDPNTAIAMYEAGELDITDIPKAMIPEYVAAGTAKVFSDGAEYFLMANYIGTTPETGKLLGNANFLRAIGYGIDRTLYINAVLGDASIPATRYNLPQLNIINNAENTQVNFNETYPLEAYPATADLAKANEYLDLALQECGMTRDTMPVFSFVTRDADTWRLGAEALQDMLITNLGIQIDIRQVEYKQWLELINNHEYDLSLYGWGPDYDDPMTYMDLWMTKPGGNMANYDNAEYTELVAFAKTTTDMKARAEAIYEAEKLLLDGGPIIPVYFRATAYVMNENLGNIDRPFIGGQPKCMYATFG